MRTGWGINGGGRGVDIVISIHIPGTRAAVGVAIHVPIAGVGVGIAVHVAIAGPGVCVAITVAVVAGSGEGDSGRSAVHT